MTSPAPKTPPPRHPAGVVRSFIEDPVIRTVGLLLLVAAGLLLYLEPRAAIPPAWRGAPVPAEWQDVRIAGRLAIALPPDVQPMEDSGAAAAYANNAFQLRVYLDDAAAPVGRDPQTMEEFRATTVTLDGHRARMGMWRTKTDGAVMYQLGVHVADKRTTLLFQTDFERGMGSVLTAVHTVEFIE
jgi:hypothetical protein